MESILTSIKKMLGISESYEHFDTDIIIHINSVFMDLNQLGVGPSNGFVITDEDDIWSDYIEDITLLQAVKSYMYLRVKLLFDPSSIGSSTLAAYERQIQQWEWRLNIKAETVDFEETPTTPAIPSTVSGVVVDCVKLNIRSKPSSDADIVSTIVSGTNVTIDTSKNTDEWYYIYTADGVTGYCLKTNIRVYL